MNRNDIWKIGTLTVAPFDWLEASYFYYRPRDLRWNDGDGKEGHDLDKGFNVKASYKPSLDILPRFAIGIDDLAGTGYFAREYFVSTFDFEHLKLTIGAGWGKYDQGKGISNPLSLFQIILKIDMDQEHHMEEHLTLMNGLQEMHRFLVE